MNGPPVCLCQKTENAPTWRPRKHIFGPRFLALFDPNFGDADAYFIHSNPNSPNPPIYIFIFAEFSLSQVRIILDTHPHLTFNPTTPKKQKQK